MALSCMITLIIIFQNQSGKRPSSSSSRGRHLNITWRRIFRLDCRSLPPAHQLHRPPCEPVGSRPRLYRWRGCRPWLSVKPPPLRAAPRPWRPRSCQPCRARPSRGEHLSHCFSRPSRSAHLDRRTPPGSVRVSQPRRIPRATLVWEAVSIRRQPFTSHVVAAR